MRGYGRAKNARSSRLVRFRLSDQQELDRQIKSQQATIEKMQHQLEDLIRSKYGRSSEKLDINQLMMEGLVLDADGEGQPPEPPPAEPAPAKPRAKSKHKGRRPLPDHLPRHEIIVPAAEEQKICPVTGQPRPFIGYEDSQKLEYIPETLRVNVYRREKYGSPMGAEENGVFTAELPPAVVNRCSADTGMLVHVAWSRQDQRNAPLGGGFRRRAAIGAFCFQPGP